MTCLNNICEWSYELPPNRLYNKLIINQFVVKLYPYFIYINFKMAILKPTLLNE
jgi:hypothetical protein